VAPGHADDVTVAIPESGKALLFDIDGTLADTDALHLQAFSAFDDLALVKLVGTAMNW
jgi:phosphoglycolate phosphatase-like HAD superfamily hydrolase